MSEGMIGLVPLDELRGVAGDLFGKLVGGEGPVFAAELKKFVLKQPCWVGTGTSEKTADLILAPPRPARLPMPKEGEVFELTLDGDAPENDPIEMVRRDGCNQPEKWQYTGERVKGLQTRRFKLVSVGYCRSLNELTQKLAGRGRIPKGQWREALKAAYRHDWKGPVGIAESSWVRPDGGAGFPYVDSYGDSYFRWADGDFSDGWRWLVELESK